MAANEIATYLKTAPTSGPDWRESIVSLLDAKTKDGVRCHIAFSNPLIYRKVISAIPQRCHFVSDFETNDSPGPFNDHGFRRLR
jgi:hypothetical protein